MPLSLHGSGWGMDQTSSLQRLLLHMLHLLRLLVCLLGSSGRIFFLNVTST